MNSLYFKITDFNVEVRSSDTPLKHLKINIQLSSFVATEPAAANLLIHLTSLPVLFRKGMYVGSNTAFEVRQISFSKRQLIHEKFGRTLAVIYDNTEGPVRHIELQAENQEAIDEILFDLIAASTTEFVEGYKAAGASPFKTDILRDWPFLVRPDNFKTLYRIVKMRFKKPKL